MLSEPAWIQYRWLDEILPKPFTHADWVKIKSALEYVKSMDHLEYSTGSNTVVLDKPAPIPIDTGEQRTCGACDWFGYKISFNDPEGPEPHGSLIDDQRCELCHELVCNRHIEDDFPLDHFVSDHGEPIGDMEPTDADLCNIPPDELL